jgi:hypothetical protein
MRDGSLQVVVLLGKGGLNGVGLLLWSTVWMLLHPRE